MGRTDGKCNPPRGRRIRGAALHTDRRRNLIRLLIVRHGETAWNASGRFQGQTDTPLNAAGHAQAVAVGDRLASEELHAVYSSDLRRAYDTALAVAAPHGLEVHADARLRELNFGDWQGLTYAQIASDHADALAYWNEDRVNRCPPGGESLGQVAQRLEALLDEIRGLEDGAPDRASSVATTGLGSDTAAKANGDRTVALVSHGGTARLILCLLLDYPLGDYWRFEVDNTAIAIIELQDHGPVLIRWNDTHHLEDTQRQSVF